MAMISRTSLHAAGDGVELLEGGLGVLGDDGRQGGLAGAGRAVEDAAGQPVGLDGPAQQPARADELLLAGELLQRGRPHAVRQGRAALSRQGKQVHCLTAFVRSASLQYTSFANRIKGNGPGRASPTEESRSLKGPGRAFPPAHGRAGGREIDLQARYGMVNEGNRRRAPRQEREGCQSK